VRIVRDVRYASAPRAVMDVYLPDGASLANGAGAIADAVGGRGGGGGGGGGDSDSSAFPVALFVHGGVWAVGEKWHFAPMASRLAEEGVIACVATYTLFPRAEADQVRSIQNVFTNRSVSTFDRSPFQLTGELFVTDVARSLRRGGLHSGERARIRRRRRARVAHRAQRGRARVFHGASASVRGRERRRRRRRVGGRPRREAHAETIFRCVLYTGPHTTALAW
jgi:hypothetical protein